MTATNRPVCFVPVGVPEGRVRPIKATHVKEIVIVTPLKPASWTHAEEFVPEDEVLANARARSEEVGVVPIGSGGGAALRFLASVLEARAVVEIGTGTGVSGLWLLRGMRPDGVLTTVDTQAEHQRLAKQGFTEDGIASQRFRLITGRGARGRPAPDRRPLRPGLLRRRQARVLRLPHRGVAAASPRWRGGLRQRPVARPRGRPGPARRRDGRDPRARQHRPRLTSPCCRCCCPWATACWWPRRSGLPRPDQRASYDDTETNPSGPPATATTSHSSIRVGPDPMIFVTGESSGTEGLVEGDPGGIVHEHVVALEPLAGPHPPGLEAESLPLLEAGVRLCAT